MSAYLRKGIVFFLHFKTMLCKKAQNFKFSNIINNKTGPEMHKNFCTIYAETTIDLLRFSENK